MRGQLAFLASVLLHAGLAVLLLAVPVTPPRNGHAWIEVKSPPPPALPPPPEPEPEPLPEPAPAPEARPEASRKASRRTAQPQQPAGPAPAAGAPEGSAPPLSGLPSTGPGLPFDMPGESGPKGMAFPPPGEKPGTETVGPARKPAPIRLDDGTRTTEEVRRLAREVKQGLEAQPHSNTTPRGEWRARVAKQSTFFPGFGDIPSDKVCRTRDGKALRTTVPAFDLTVCDRWEKVDYGDVDPNTHEPRDVCVDWHVEHLEEKTLEAPRVYLSFECMERDQDPWHVVIDWEKKTVERRCLRWEYVERENPLTYRAREFKGDVGEDTATLVKVEIPICDEPAEGEAPANASRPAEDGTTARSGG